MSNYIELVRELCQYSSKREWFEFKENWFNADELGEYISALANSAAILGKRYAYFLWGVTDESHDIIGTNFDFDADVKGEPLKHYLARQLEPDINFDFEEIFVDTKRLVLLVIPAAKSVPVAFRGVRYIRIGSSKENLRKYPEKESYLFGVLRSGVPSMENTPSQYQDLTFDTLLMYYNLRHVKLNPNTFQKNLSFFTEDGKYNLLAQLLSDNPRFPIRMAFFQGKTKADVLQNLQVFDDHCILWTIESVLRYCEVLNLKQVDERDRVFERKEVPLFSEAAYREAIINAFVHNKWVEGCEPMFTVFSDRIEIMSRGSLAPGQTMGGFFAGESVPVNKGFADILLQLRISERTGRGVPKIIEEYGKEAYTFGENSITVTIPFNWLNQSKRDSSSRTGFMTGF